MTLQRMVLTAVLIGGPAWFGCSARRVDVASLQRPERAAELDAFDAFVGNWKWTATMEVGESSETWSGTSRWSWTLDKRCLQGQMTTRSANQEYETVGLWGWNAKQKQYEWSMFNSWGYPQVGTADYDASDKSWTLKYRSVGMDGTTSYGRMGLTIVDANTMDWTMTEWADPLHLVKKMRLTGRFTRENP